MGFTIPKITISADYGDDSSFGDVDVISVGYGCHQAWIYACMFGVQLFPAAGVKLHLGNSLGAFSLMYIVSIIVFSMFLIIAGALDRKIVDLVVKRRILIVGAGMMGTGTALWIALGWLGSTCVAVDVLCGVLTGFGSGALLLALGISFARCDALSIYLNSAVALVIAMVLYAFLLHHVPEVVRAAIVSLLPLAEFFILWRKTPSPYYERGELPVFNPLPINRSKFLAAFGLPVAFFGLALGSLRQTSVQLVIPAITLDMQFLCLMAAACAALVVTVASLAFGGEESSWSKQFRIIVPAIALGMLFIPSVMRGGGILSMFFLVVSYMCFEMLLWTFFGELSQRFNLSPIFVFGFGRGIAALFSLVGSAVPLMQGILQETFEVGPAMLTLVVMAVIMFAYCLLPNENDISKLVTTCPLVQAVDAGKYIDAAASQSLQNALKDAEEQARQVEQAALAAERSMGSGNGRRWFKESCEAVAGRYLLSRRETEVLFLLAKGYNSAYIQEKLYISEGTAKTHIRHIYRKLDIHNQQELMRIVENGE